MKKFLPTLLLVLSGLSQAEPFGAANGDGMRLVGEAKLSVLLWDVYRASLYTPTGQFQGITAPLKLQLVYLRDIPATKLVETTRDQWQKLGLYQPESEAWLKQLQSMWPDVRSGDSITLVLDNQQRSHFHFNGNAIGSIDHPRFGKMFAAIWLSEKTEFPKARKQLIGES